MRAGSGGWIAHLPIDREAEKRAYGLALIVAQMPLLVVWIGLFGVARWLEPEAIRWILLGCLPLVATSAASAALPVERRWLTWPLSLLALIAASRGSGLGIISSGTLILICWWSGGPMQRRQKQRPVAGRRLSPSWLPLGISWRAFGVFALLQGYGLALLPLGASALFLANNADLTAKQQAIGVRLGAGLAINWLLVHVADRLTKVRSPWGWSRSLPWSARQRIIQDAALLAVATLPLLILCALLHLPSVWVVIATVPYLAIRLAGAMRRRRESLTKLGAATLSEVAILALVCGLSAVTGWLMLLACPIALRYATRREQRLKPSAWSERHDLGAGDPALWSDNS